MPLIEIKTIIYADIQTCFDGARHIDFHKTSMKHTKERALAGKTSGHIGLQEWVTWEAVHFGIRQQLTSKITAFEAPNYFVDEMVTGAFKSFKHEHVFQEEKNHTIMTDHFSFVSPLGILGRVADMLFLTRYMTHLLTTRNQCLKKQIEAL